jgi:hypothetical protein
MDLEDSSGMVSGKVKMMVEVGLYMVGYGFGGFLRRISGKGSYSGWTFPWWKVGLFFCPMVRYRRNFRKSKDVGRSWSVHGQI